jgi:hypothetical protein
MVRGREWQTYKLYSDASMRSNIIMHTALTDSTNCSQFGYALLFIACYHDNLEALAKQQEK